MKLEWTDEDTRIVEEYLHKFYMIGYPLETLAREIMTAPNTDSIIECSSCEVSHPSTGVVIHIIGRDH